MKPRILLLAILALFASIRVNAQCTQNCNFIYVSTGGSGTVGSANCPVSLATALANPYGAGLVQTGRTVILMEAGTYTSNSTLTIPSGVTIDGGYNVDGSGNWYKSTGTQTKININPPLITVTPGGTTVGAYIGMVAGGNNFELKDLTISVLSGGASGNTNGYGNSVYGLYLDGQTGYTISRCAFSTGVGSAGIAGGTLAGTGGGYVGGGGGSGGNGTTNACPCGVTTNPCNGSTNGSGTGGTGSTGSGPWGGGGGGGGGGGCNGSGCNSAGCNSNGCGAGVGSTGNNGNAGTQVTAQPTPNNSTNGYLAYFVPVNGAQGGAGDGGGGGGGGGGGVTGNLLYLFVRRRQR